MAKSKNQSNSNCWRNEYSIVYMTESSRNWKKALFWNLFLGVLHSFMSFQVPIVPCWSSPQFQPWCPHQCTEFRKVQKPIFVCIKHLHCRIHKLQEQNWMPYAPKKPLFVSFHSHRITEKEASLLMILENYIMHFTPVGWEEIQEAKAHDNWILWWWKQEVGLWKVMKEMFTSHICDMWPMIEDSCKWAAASDTQHFHVVFGIRRMGPVPTGSLGGLVRKQLPWHLQPLNEKSSHHDPSHRSCIKLPHVQPTDFYQLPIISDITTPIRTETKRSNLSPIRQRKAERIILQTC